MNLKLVSVLAVIVSSAALLLLYAGKIDHRSEIFLAVENLEIEEAFIQYIAKYGKEYASK